MRIQILILGFKGLLVLSSTFLFFQVCIDTCTSLFKSLWFSQTDRIGSDRIGHSEALRAVNLRRFLALRLLLATCNLFNSINP